MTRSPDATWTPDQPVPFVPPAAWSHELAVTVAVQGPRRIVLDVLAAGSTRLSGTEPAVRRLLERAASELATRLPEHGRLLVVRPLPDPFDPSQPGGAEARGVGVIVVATCREALRLVTAGGAGGGAGGGPVVVLVHPEPAARTGDLGA